MLLKVEQQWPISDRIRFRFNPESSKCPFLQGLSKVYIEKKRNATYLVGPALADAALSLLYVYWFGMKPERGEIADRDRICSSESVVVVALRAGELRRNIINIPLLVI